MSFFNNLSTSGGQGLGFGGGTTSNFSFGNPSSTSTNLFDNKSSLFPTQSTLNSSNNALSTSFLNSNSTGTNLFGTSNSNQSQGTGLNLGTNSFSMNNTQFSSQTQSATLNMMNLPLQQRQELERIEKRKVSLQKGLSLQMNPTMTALTYQLDEKAPEKQQEVDNYIYYNLNDEGIIKNLNDAKKLNPNPSKCYTLPIKGFGELVQREQQQRKELENLLCEMKSVKDENVKILQTLNTSTIKRVEECKKRHQSIIHQLVHISCMIEEYGEKNHFAQVNYQLDNQLNQVLHQIQENHMKLGAWQSSINQIETNIKYIDEQLNDNDSKNCNDLKNLLESSPNKSGNNSFSDHLNSSDQKGSENNHSISDLNNRLQQNQQLSSTNGIYSDISKNSRETSTNSPSNVEAIFETLDSQQQLLESLSDTVRNDSLLIQQFIS
ncbi:hypothetical protein [Cryptosporidium parvum Iowa II]|uniref:Nucleoporin Nup54 alpha-helical domain-containing protein n=2 Tax=Cryptosporidium parvum TaxID=5807 RepID=Q5CQJ5_CRYPI|nr:hypothetical protein [Cryptosporidium parvum Iowa II]EAK87601.1 hypothetical protein cgd4_460 [Cryptosporidium parvum Iowa II]QOY41935.1 Nucleoporin complex subunit 54 [Cryptosporidium parvum]WKS77238.1 hypothetical protein CPCDC_4g460 [Cryptosporidium sp. 43IA8]WRK32093.1 Nucleoporin complex subunit 54 [Cryptosporidium parvum]|eukprot:QOY41935.1 hypothetical protein CPATCC_001525 [Cryptosporidium parvum]